MPKRKASNSSVTKKVSNSLNDRNEKSAEASGMKKLKKQVLQGPLDGADDSRDQSEDLPEEDPEEESGEEQEEESCEELEEDPEEGSGEELEEDPEEESGEELEKEPEDESYEEVEEEPEGESGEEVEEKPEEELGEELEEETDEESGEKVEEEPEGDFGEEVEKEPEEESGEEVEEEPEEESGDEVEEEPEEELGEELEKEPDEEFGEEVEEEPEQESGEEAEKEPEEGSGYEVEEVPEEESGEEMEEDPEEESGDEVEEEPDEELGEELEKEPDEESGEKVEEEPEEESGEEVEEEPEEESGEEVEEVLEEESGEEVEEEPEEESGEEVEEEPEEESGEELEEDPEEFGEELEEDSQEESGEEQEEDLEDETGEELEEDPEEDPEIDDKQRNASGNEVPLSSQASLYQSQNRYKQEGILELGKNTVISAATTDKSGSKEEGAGNSGKRRRSRWEPQPDGDGLKEDDQASKRRSTRWSSEESQMKMPSPLQLPYLKENFAIGLDKDPRIWGLKSELLEINRKLQSPIIDDRPEGERSPSPDPVYDNLGIRVNTREVRFRRRLTQKRQNIISKLIKLDPTFNPPPDYTPQKLVKKIYIPVKEYPDYNFIGLIIGPRGNTQKRMEKETGAKILLRGKGSLKTPGNHDSEYDDLHVRIEAKIQESLDAAVTMVEKLLIPIEDRRNDHKCAQLKELADLKATQRDENVCSVCGDQGHRHYACPNLQSTFKMDSFGIGCSNTLSTPTFPATALFTHSSSLPGSGLSLSSMQKRETKPGKEISDKNLYVGYLPQSVDDNRLSELFSPFGKITEAKVVKDRSTGLSKGYGFVKFEDSKDAATAIAHLDGFKTDGKLLKVRIAGLQPNYETPRLNPIPQIPGRAALSTNVTNRKDLSGPLHFMLPEHQSSFDDTSRTNMFSCTVNSDHDDPMKANALAFTPPGNALISPHFGYSGQMQFSHQSLSSSNNSTSQFPGDPSKLGNFNPFL